MIITDYITGRSHQVKAKKEALFKSDRKGPLENDG
jgi:hypothetical protein